MDVVPRWAPWKRGGDGVDVQRGWAAGLGDHVVGGEGDAEGAAVGADGAGEAN